MNDELAQDRAQETPLPLETEGQPVQMIASRTLPNKAQVTKCSLEGVVFYVRENAGAGKAWLDLCAPEFHWLRLSGIVKCEDSLEREVRKDPAFTAEWAEQVLADVPPA